MKTEFKVGDWLFCEFKLQQVKEIKDGQIKSVGDGWMEHSSQSLNDRCYPLERRVKCISDCFKNQYDKLHREAPRNLNFPDISRWMIAKWCEVCEVRSDDKAVEAGIRDLDEWCNNLIRRCEELESETYRGVKLFR